MKKTKLFYVIGLLLPVIFLSACKTGTENPAPACAWQTTFWDEFQEADGPLGSNYTLQVNSGTGSAAIVSKTLELTGPMDYWAIRYTGTVEGDIQRISMKFLSPETFTIGVAGKSRDLGNNWQQQEFYLAVMNDTLLTIQKCQGMFPTLLAQQTISVTTGHEYQLALLIDGTALTATIEDLTAGFKFQAAATDTGTPNTGTTVSMNGCCLSATDKIRITEFKVEACK